VNFKYDDPIPFHVLPWGSTCTIITKEYEQAGMEMDANTAGLMLAAVLVDTVITKSPTCSDKDKEVIERLAGLAGIEDWKQFGMELFKVRSSVQDSAALDIIKGDFKDFETSVGRIGIGQVETVDLSEFDSRQEELLRELESLRNSEGYHTTVLFITDIMQEGSKFLVATSDEQKVKEALGAELENGVVYLEGVISRKKQVAPKFLAVFDQ
jgi:manganese-dependent inorganic pyrophosphatase